MAKQMMMPMSSAGILGVGSNMELAGIKVSPKVVLAGALIFIGVVKIADKVLTK
ncbi:MAG: preprotein translocase subunit Sec61beta [Candidatus ainarchaeum sp.]|nr:preprotein translocase subunit Sec61beta [Candidatus ainarchaeum sp.]